jgi:hypothetical protein
MFECKRQRAALRTLAAEATSAAAAAEQRGLRADETKPEWDVCQVLMSTEANTCDLTGMACGGENSRWLDADEEAEDNRTSLINIPPAPCRYLQLHLIMWRQPCGWVACLQWQQGCHS